MSNKLQILRKQVKNALAEELKYDAEIRAAFDWRYVVNIGGQEYLVGKTGANTCYYQSPNECEIVPCFPDDLLTVIDSWQAGQYISYTILRSTDGKVIGSTTDLSVALTKMPKKFQKGISIVGIKANGVHVNLYHLKDGLSGMKYVKTKSHDLDR